MTDHAALMAAIAENPNDDTPRLIFADLIEDNGESARAAFIRQQIENARRETGRTWTTLHHRWLDCEDFDKFLSIPPWECIGAKHVTPLLVLKWGSHRKSSYARCIAWFRGFPAILSCTGRDWMRLHRLPFLDGAPIAELYFDGGGGRISQTKKLERWPNVGRVHSRGCFASDFDEFFMPEVEQTATAEAAPWDITLIEAAPVSRSR